MVEENALRPGRPSILLPLLLLLTGTAAAQDTSAVHQIVGKPDQSPVATRGIFVEPQGITKGIEFMVGKVAADGRERKDGFYPELGKNMITGSGWISVGSGYRRHLKHRTFVDASAALSWRGYKMAQARIEMPPLLGDRLTIGSRVMWQDLAQVNYFGMGNASLQSKQSNYRLRTTNLMAYSTLRLNKQWAIGTTLGRLDHTTVSRASGWHVAYPDTQEIFGEDGAPGLTEQPSFIHGDLSLTFDSRDHPGHPTRGGFYRATWERFANRDGGRFSFQRYEGEVGHFLSVVRHVWVIAARGWTVISTADDGNIVPFYLLPTLGGQNTLRGYPDYRFHDRDLIAITGESRWAITSHVDGPCSWMREQWPSGRAICRSAM
jgi:hypothetical protein